MSRNRSQRMETARSNALLMSIVIVVAFIICWAPYSTLAILLHVDFAKDHLQIPNWLSQLIFVSAYSSSCVNPFVHSSHYLIGCDLCNSQETTSQTTAASNANLNRSRNKKTHHRHRRENDPDDDELELNRMNHQYQMDNGETDTIVHRVTTVITVDVMDEMKSGTGNIETVVWRWWWSSKKFSIPHEFHPSHDKMSRTAHREIDKSTHFRELMISEGRVEREREMDRDGTRDSWELVLISSSFSSSSAKMRMMTRGTSKWR